MDHVTDWARGGDSDRGNLAPVCRMHHRFEHESGAELVALDPGVFLWRTPRGMQYVTAPDPPLLDDDLIRIATTVDGGAR